MTTYSCPGINMPDPPDAPFPGYVACYRAGHKCPPKVKLRTESETHVMIKYRCPCCGDGGPSFGIPKEWESREFMEKADDFVIDWGKE